MRSIVDQPVLIVIANDFQSDYVTSALSAAGASIIGPVRTTHEAVNLVEDHEQRLVTVLSERLEDGDCTQLLTMLENRKMPHLLLRPPTASEHPAATSVLREPFASYQVVDWVVAVIGGE